MLSHHCPMIFAIFIQFFRKLWDRYKSGCKFYTLSGIAWHTCNNHSVSYDNHATLCSQLAPFFLGGGSMASDNYCAIVRRLSCHFTINYIWATTEILHHTNFYSFNTTVHWDQAFTLEQHFLDIKLAKYFLVQVFGSYAFWNWVYKTHSSESSSDFNTFLEYS